MVLRARQRPYDPYAIIINSAFVFKFPEYKYCAYDLYKSVDVLQYLRLYEQYPQVEYLVKLGFSDYVHSKQILRECETNKAFCIWLIQNKAEIAGHKYYVFTLLKAFKSKRPCDDIQQEELLRKELTANSTFKPLREFFKGSLQAFISYMVCRNIGLRSYLDYFQAIIYKVFRNR